MDKESKRQEPEIMPPRPQVEPGRSVPEIPPDNDVPQKTTPARIDFLRKGSEYTFPEANYSGEWAWLDRDGTEGLMAKIVHEIDPDTPCMSCPRP